MAKTPSPCIDVCKFKRQGHCIGCSMTKAQKQMFKDLPTNKTRRTFVQLIATQQAHLGKYTAWPRAYLRKCEKKGVKPPI